jgi:hypothetical protein
MRLFRRAAGPATSFASLAIALIAVSALGPSPARAASIYNLSSIPKISKVSAGTTTAPVTFRHRTSTGKYWTRARMLSAKPADLDPPESNFDIPSPGGDATVSSATGDFTPGNVTGFPQRIQGRVFFTLDGANYGCSGTVVDSADRDVIFSAAHCLFDETAKRYVDNLIFVPAYDNGNAPYGQFALASGSVPKKWTQSLNHSYDIAVVKLDSPIQDILGARQIAFDLSPMISKKKKRQYTIFGYPSTPSEIFDGETLRGCRSSFQYFDGSAPNVVPYPIAASPCQMGHGASGGGWITLGNYLNSVVSYGYCEEKVSTCGLIYGAYFSNAAKALYQWAGGSPAPTVKLLGAPPRVVRKRKVSFKFGSVAATLPGFLCKLDRQKTVGCSSKISINRLSPGRHTIRVWAVDQTGHRSKKRITRRFRVILPRG